VGNGILLAFQSRTAAADGRLGVALGATVSVEGRTEAGASLAGKTAGNGVHFLEDGESLLEHGSLGSIQTGEGASGAGRTSAGAGVHLCSERKPGAEHEDNTTCDWLQPTDTHISSRVCQLQVEALLSYKPPARQFAITTSVWRRS